MDEIALTLWLQANPALQGVMRALSFLGQQEFFLAMLPVLFVFASPRQAIRISVFLLVQHAINATAKLGTHSPRPYWVDPRVTAGATETSYGLPSGHAQTAAIWLYAASVLHWRWLWPLAIALPVLIGLSRVYLGVHFAGDVLGGWLLGLAVLALYLAFEARVVAWLKRQTFTAHLLLGALVAAVILLAGILTQAAVAGIADPAGWAQYAGHARDLDDFFTASGALFGLLAGAALAHRAGFDLGATPPTRRLRRLLLAVAGSLVLWLGLKQIFPTQPEALGHALRWVRYALTTLWVSYGVLRVEGGTLTEDGGTLTEDGRPRTEGGSHG